jgi:long-chain acyl-CoA synthetase
LNKKSEEQFNVSLPDLLALASREHPNKPAVSFLERKFTYAQLNSLTNSFAAGLAALGLKKGDKAAIFLPNIPQFIIAFYGILKAGGVVNAINCLYKAREVEYQVSDSDAQTIVVLDSLWPVVKEIWQKTQLRNVIIVNLDSLSSEVSKNPLITVEGLTVYSFEQLLVENKYQKSPQVYLDPAQDLASLQYTGGTTGKIKAAMLTHRNLVSNAITFGTWIKGKAAKEVFLVALPLSHIYGMTTSMNVPVSLAAEMVLLPRFESLKALECIEKRQVTVFCGVPAMYQTLLANPDLGKHKLSSIRVCISGASTLNAETQKRFMQISGGLLAEGYGLTEASPVTHCNPVDLSMTTVKVGSIGLPLPHTEAKIVDVETGTKTLNIGEMGELVVRGPQVMKGYWKNPAETALVIRDCWLFTGDLARMDTDGYFYIIDRKKDLIKYKGYSIYPRELEEVLYEHPAVKICAVVGKPDQEAGEIPKAFVVLKDGAVVSAKQLIAFVNAKVAPYKAIREMEFRKELPLGTVGKVLKRVLRDEGVLENKP